MTASKIVIGLVLLSFGLAIPTDAEANLCRGNYLKSVHRAEAIELENASFSSSSDCNTDVDRCFIGERSLNEMILACNRKRDFDIIAGQQVPKGALLDQRTVANRNYPDDLPSLAITGQFNYLGSFLKRYGYLLERQGGNWITTAILDFKFPDAEKDKLHIPMLLVELLSETARGPNLTTTICATDAVNDQSNGLVYEDPDDTNARACRVNRDSNLFLRSTQPLHQLNPRNPPSHTSRVKTDWTPLPEALHAGSSRPVTEWLMLYWRSYIERYWSRPNDSFQMKVEIANFVGRPDEISEDQLASYQSIGIVYPVELHHNEGRSNNMYRPIKVLGIKIYKAIYAGEKYSNFVHEFGHSLGLGDDYATKSNPPTRRDCRVLSGYKDLSSTPVSYHTQKRYVMCYGGAEEQHTKSIYLWIVTQRYPVENATSSVPTLNLREFCQNGRCPSGKYCKKPANRCEPLKSIGERCSKDAACASPAVCAGKPRGRCVVEADKGIDETCFKDGECGSGRCTNSICVCTSNTDCTAKYGSGFACATTALKVNRCVQTCSTDTQCPGNQKCKKPIGATFHRCK